MSAPLFHHRHYLRIAEIIADARGKFGKDDTRVIAEHFADALRRPHRSRAIAIPRDIFPLAPMNPVWRRFYILRTAALTVARLTAWLGAVVLLAVMPARSQDLPDIRSAIARAGIVAHTQPPRRCVIDLHTSDKGGVSYWLPTLINGRLGGMFILDTGLTAALVIPRSFLSHFIADGTITALDQPGPKKRAVLADGSEVVEETVIIRDFALPFCRAFYNVVAIISNGGAPLIGQGILSLFRAATIDHENSVLVLDP
jgi:hypothetical protein